MRRAAFVLLLIPVVPLLAVGRPPPPIIKPSAIVTRFDDPSPPPETCTTTPADCSLRGAIEFVRLHPDVDSTISLPAGTYVLQSALAVFGSLGLTGTLAATTIIDAQGLDRVMVVDAS